MNRIKLVNFLESYGDGIHGTPNYENNGEYYFINGNNLRDDCILLNATNRISKEEYIRIKRPLHANSLLLSINGTLGNVARYGGEKIALGKSVCYLNIKRDYNRDFFFYLIKTKEFQTYIQLVAHGSTIKNLAPSQVAEYEFEMPKNINKLSKTLSLIDSKISLNNKIISELESIAKTIYDYWFLQFEFPNEEGKPYKSSGGKMVWNEELKREIPEGWKVTKIGTLCGIKRGISYNSSNMDMNGIPILSLASINRQGKYIPNGIKYFNGQYSNDKILKPYDMIMCNTDMTQEKEIIAKAILVPDIFENRDILSTHHISHVIFADETYKEYLYMTTQTPWFHNYIKGFSSGTNVVGLDVYGFKNYNLLIPSKEILHIFTKFIQNIEKQKSNLLKKNQELTSLRDFLLPLLMNGQVSFKKIDE